MKFLVFLLTLPVRSASLLQSPARAATTVLP